MDDRKQNIIGVIALIIIIIVNVFFWLLFIGNGTDTDEGGVILTPLEVTADPAAFTGSEIKVEGIVIARNPNNSSFIIMPIDIYISCDRNAYCGEEYTHLSVIFNGKIPSLEHDVIITGNLLKKSDDNYKLEAIKINDKGKI
jgi:hypothetical protein